MLTDPLANALSKIQNADHRHKPTCKIWPSSKVIKKVLTLMNDHKFIGTFSEEKTSQGMVLTLNLIGAVNKCGAVKPRYSVKSKAYENYEKQYLPAKDFGLIVVSTPQGIMTHNEAKQKLLGGRLLAYIY